eukprot:7385726-Prymnesium_polylepis.1
MVDCMSLSCEPASSRESRRLASEYHLYPACCRRYLSMRGARATDTTCMSSHSMSSPVSCMTLLAGETPIDSTCSNMRMSD